MVQERRLWVDGCAPDPPLTLQGHHCMAFMQRIVIAGLYSEPNVWCPDVVLREQHVVDTWGPEGAMMP